MNNLKKKLKKQEGFTLVEMLIVVAIIAILIAVSIPMVSSSLEKAREAVDKANMRSAIGLAMIEVLSDDPSNPTITGETTWGYVVTNNQGSLEVGAAGYPGQSAKAKTLNLTVTYTPGTGGAEGSFKTSFDTALGAVSGGNTP